MVSEAALWNSDYLDLLDALAAEQVEYLIVGAFALAVHGLPRATGDLDLFVRASATNAVQLIRALTRFGAPLTANGVDANDFATPGAVYQIGVVPRRIDLLTELSGVTFEDAWSERTTALLGSRSLPVLGRQSLLRNKRATGRAKDLADVEALERLGRR